MVPRNKVEWGRPHLRHWRGQTPNAAGHAAYCGRLGIWRLRRPLVNLHYVRAPSGLNASTVIPATPANRVTGLQRPAKTNARNGLAGWQARPLLMNVLKRKAGYDALQTSGKASPVSGAPSCTVTKGFMIWLPRSS